MAEKDIAEKMLEAYNDVFADIVNVLLFNGQEIIGEEDLEDAQPVSGYKIDDQLHEQERDVAKYWKNTHVRLALYGFENQTVIDPAMPLRVISYDGAAYRAQLLKNKSEDREASTEQPLYPVITMVLYFGKTPWVKNKTLKACLTIPESLKPYVSDYKINVFDIPRLTGEQVNAFKSDFKIVADYFVQSVNDCDYNPPHEVVRHVDEILKMMRILTKDPRFEMPIMDTKHQKEGVTMSEILDKLIEKGREEEREAFAKEKAAYAARESGYLSEIGALKAELAKYKAAGIRV